jgi:anti-anti-sigma factor
MKLNAEKCGIIFVKSERASLNYFTLRGTKKQREGNKMRVVAEDFEKLQIYDVVVEVVNLTRATYREAAQLKKILDNDIENKIRKIVVDLSQCEFIDSTFLGVLVLSLKASAKIGGDIRLVKPAEVAKSLMEKAGTLNVFNIYSSLDDAVQSFDFPSDKNYYLSNGASLLS